MDPSPCKGDCAQLQSGSPAFSAPCSQRAGEALSAKRLTIYNPREGCLCASYASTGALGSFITSLGKLLRPRCEGLGPCSNPRGTAGGARLLQAALAPPLTATRPPIAQLLSLGAGAQPAALLPARPNFKHHRIQGQMSETVAEPFLLAFCSAYVLGFAMVGMERDYRQEASGFAGPGVFCSACPACIGVTDAWADAWAELLTSVGGALSLPCLLSWLLQYGWELPSLEKPRGEMSIVQN
jgi:hypothetical protein